MNRKLLLLQLTLVAFSSSLKAEIPSETFDDLDDLVSAGKYKEGLVEARRLREELPSESRLTTWELNFRGEAKRAVPGQHVLFYQLSVPNSHKDALGRKDALPSISANKERSDWRHIVVCLDMDTGAIRWSREVNGLFHLAVDPRTDDLYLWREILLRIDATNGEVLLERELPGDPRKIAGLLLGHKLAIPQRHGSGRVKLSDSKLLMYDPQLDALEECDLSDYWLVAPNENSRLVYERGGWNCIEVASGTTLWRLEQSQLSMPPLWHNDRLHIYAGTDMLLGTVSAMDMATGQPHWITHLGWGAYSIRQHQLRGGSYPDEDWVPLKALAQDLLAIDGSGRMVFLNADDGSVRTSVHYSPDYLCLPTTIGSTLVICSFEWARALPLANIFNPEACHEAFLRLTEARCLVGLNRLDEAIGILDYVVDRAPNHAAAWAMRGDVCRSLSRWDEASFSYCHAMSLEGRVADATMRDDWGLLRFFHLGGKPAWQVQQVEDRLYVGTQGGQLWSITSDSLTLRLEQTLRREITILDQPPNLVARRSVGSGSTTTINLKPSYRAVRSEVPREWTRVGGEKRIGASVSYAGRQFRPLKGGGVRVLNGKEISELPGVLPDVGVWQFYVSPEKHLGYGEGGIFELDEDLRPSRYLYRPAIDGKKPKWSTVRFLRTTAETMGFVVETDLGAALQVCSRDGELLNEALLGRFVSGRSYKDQLILLGDGYLFSDRQLVWAGVREGMIWRFGPPYSRTSRPYRVKRWRYFGRPTVTDGRLCVTALDGHLLVFDSLLIQRIATRRVAGK